MWISFLNDLIAITQITNMSNKDALVLQSSTPKSKERRSSVVSSLDLDASDHFPGTFILIVLCVAYLRKSIYKMYNVIPIYSVLYDLLVYELFFSFFLLSVSLKNSDQSRINLGSFCQTECSRDCNRYMTKTYV